MATNTTTVSPIIPEEWLDELIVQPVTQESVAMNSAVSQTITITGQVGHLPMITDDVGANWVTEAQEITPDDASFDTLTVQTSKVAALSVVSNEAVNDADRDVLALVGQGIARSIAKKIDAAYFGEPVVASPAPSGLGGITPSSVSAGSAFSTLDSFTTAVSIADAQGTPITAWVLNPADMLTLSLIKVQTGSQLRLLGTDPTQPTRGVIEGRPVFTSPAVKAGSVWGMPNSRAFVVMRQGVELQRSTDAYFTSDQTAIRAIMRLGFAFPQPACVVKVAKTS